VDSLRAPDIPNAMRGTRNAESVTALRSTERRGDGCKIYKYDVSVCDGLVCESVWI
jgi:predicted transcriptional regulator